MSRPIPMPMNEPGDYLEASDLVYVSDLPQGAERGRIERELAERMERFRKLSCSAD